mmetsp:Transcript_8588/g.35947  ORF Transcript_8588/g.35947 Transcript_8588/m.35947 type:complete len:273 (+) Transcript_8588:500-1318(+)
MRSVATSVHVSPARKRSTCAWRFASDMPAWINPRRNPSPRNSRANCFARSLDCTKTIAGGLTPSENNCLSASGFPRSWPQNTNDCRTVSDAAFRSPTVKRIGADITDRANRSTVSGSVAENSALVTFGPSHAAAAASTCSTNPISNSLSASSNTRYVTALRHTRFFSIRLFRRKGVATSTSTLSISFICVAFVKRQHLSVFTLRHSSRRILCDCCASSFVGERSNARGPPASSSFDFKEQMMGSRNASVFPDPVGATARSSWFSRSNGMACL